MNYVTIKGNYEWIKYYQSQEGADCIRIGDRIYNWGMSLDKIYENISNEVAKYGHRTTHLEQYGYDVKFAYHLFRLFDEAEELLTTGKITFPCKNKEFYKKIRNGEFTLEYLLDKSADLDCKIKEIANKSTLRDKPDFKAIDELQQEIYLVYWHEGELI